MNPTIVQTYIDLTQVTKASIKSSPGTLRSCLITNANTALRFLQFFDKASAPVAGDVPKYSIPIIAGSATQPGTVILDEVFFTSHGINFHVGIGWAISSTLATFTDGATATDHVMVAHYV